ncbi:hypothetical protein GKZ68_11175 [Hymenobacter sp. BRD128]|uniref:hypothetical protein n=1 Tax=Hymenobacter sp. BRD128 TaxID=2675878 RepID=UPI0015640E3B|nr:hypothetical protein [Hymenobacter sp. BRD128]QKG57143.1 hypothetical protein GKZ68_11175 [Hymenobacter sp. BRD128]
MDNIIIVLLPIATAVISGYVSYYFALRSKKSEAILKFKEEKYSNLIIALQGFVGSTSSSDRKRIFFEEQYKSWLYSSDEVVKAVNRLILLVQEGHGQAPNPIEGRKVVGDIILEMRKDLLGKTDLTYMDFRYTDVIDRKE